MGNLESSYKYKERKQKSYDNANNVLQCETHNILVHNAPCHLLSDPVSDIFPATKQQ